MSVWCVNQRRRLTQRGTFFLFHRAGSIKSQFITFPETDTLSFLQFLSSLLQRLTELVPHCYSRYQRPCWIISKMLTCAPGEGQSKNSPVGYDSVTQGISLILLLIIPFLWTAISGLTFKCYTAWILPRLRKRTENCSFVYSCESKFVVATPWTLTSWWNTQVSYQIITRWDILLLIVSEQDCVAAQHDVLLNSEL